MSFEAFIKIDGWALSQREPHMNMENPLPFPTVDAAGGLNCVNEIVAIQMRNLEAMRVAQQQMLEGMGVLAKHQAEMLEGSLRRSFGAQPPAPAGSDLRTTIAGQIESLKTAIKECQSNSNVLSEIAARSSGEVANTLQSRMMAALDELKTALEHAIPEKTFVAMPAPFGVQPAVQS
jgi:phasin family protein